MVTSATTIKNEHHDDDVRTDERTNGRMQICTARKIEAGGNGGKEDRERTYQG